jgi:two-component system, cell cycle response regulator
VGDRAVAKEACLVVLYGLELGKKFDLNRPQIMIGRSSKADIQIDQDAVSRNHCKIVNTGTGILVRDMGSTNGTYVNDELVDEYTLRDGDFIKVGRCIFKFLSGNNIEAAYHEEIYRLQTVDGLTQTFNRHYFDQTLERELGRALRYRRDLSVILLDLDRFKDVNDSFGHLAGDYVLKHVASLVKARLRREDVLARYGGEEFGIVLPEIDYENALRFAEKIRNVIERAEVKFEDAIIPITVSAGVATLRPEIQEAVELVRQSETALFAAKQSGRNRVIGFLDAVLLLPDRRIKPLLAFRTALVRDCPAGSQVVALRLPAATTSSEPVPYLKARRRVEQILLDILGEESKFVGQADEHTILFVVRDRERAKVVQREVVLRASQEVPPDQLRLVLTFGEPTEVQGDIAMAISVATDFVSTNAKAGWAHQLPLPLGILTRNLLHARDAGERRAAYGALRDAAIRWLLIWLWTEQSTIAGRDDQRSRDDKYATPLREVALHHVDTFALLQQVVDEIRPHHVRLHSYHAWQRLFGGALDTMSVLASRPTLRGQADPKLAEGERTSGDEAAQREQSLLRVLKAITLIALPIVPDRNEAQERKRFEGIANVLVGDNPVVTRELLSLSAPVDAGRLYLFAPSARPLLMEPFAIYERCHECSGSELFFVDSINEHGKYVYRSATTGHLLTGRSINETPTEQHHAVTVTLPAPPDVLVITALEEERDALLRKLTFKVIPNADDDVAIFYKAEVHTKLGRKLNVLVTMLQGMGGQHASTRAMEAARRWHPRFALMVGVAGGVSEVTALGDVIVANQVADYSVGKVTGRSSRNIYWQVHQTDATLLEAANAFATGWEERIAQARPEPGTPRRHVGVIASGGDVIAYQSLVDRYHSEWPKLVGVEMEGGGVATALHQSGTKTGFLMIRGVSDFADARKNAARTKRWRAYAADSAAAYTIGLLESGLITSVGPRSSRASRQ